MKLVIQRVNTASVSIKNKIVAKIAQGLLLFVGIENNDNEEDIVWLSNKVLNLRIFNDSKGLMNFSVNDIKGNILLVSQFTLHASTKKGSRPSFIKAAKPDIAIPIYQKFIQQLEKDFNKKIATGQFGADMQIHSENNGPVTIIIDSKNRN